jgi:hypothetical protein
VKIVAIQIRQKTPPSDSIKKWYHRVDLLCKVESTKVPIVLNVDHTFTVRTCTFSTSGTITFRDDLFFQPFPANANMSKARFPVSAVDGALIDSSDRLWAAHVHQVQTASPKDQTSASRIHK